MSVSPETPVHCESHEGQCHVCGDVAVVGRVLEIDDARRTAVVAVGDERAIVALDLVDAGVGDALLVHLGFAIERLESA